MNTQNLFKFKKNIGQNYLIFNLKFFFDLCSGYNFFNNVSNDIDFYKSKFVKNKIYLKKKKNIYINFLKFNFYLFKVININISFNIIKIFFKKIKKIKKFFFKILIENYRLFFFKKKIKIFKIKFFLKKFFFPYPKINILKIYIKNNFNYLHIKFNLKLFKLIKLKSEKIKKINIKLIFLIKKNVFFSKI